MNVPRHIAIVLDGNRRYARKRSKDPWAGHEQGAKKIEELLNWCHELDIKELTLYCFSMENFNRPKREVDYLFKLFKKGDFDFVVKLVKDILRFKVRKGSIEPPIEPGI